MEESITFFFCNYPDDCKVEYLRSIFSEIGEVVDIYCPKKRDKTGRMFGFVKFVKKQIKDKKRILERLNDIWIGS